MTPTVIYVSYLLMTIEKTVFCYMQLDDGLEFSFTDKRRFAKVRLLDNVQYNSYQCALDFFFFFHLVGLGYFFSL